MTHIISFIIGSWFGFAIAAVLAMAGRGRQMSYRRRKGRTEDAV